MNTLNISGYEMYEGNMVKGEDCYVVDGNGKRYLDFESGVWALPLGHSHPKVNDAVINQLSQLVHAGYRYSHPIVETASEQLLQIMGYDGGKCIFLSSGSEAVELSLKMIRKISNRPYFLNLNGYYLSAYGISGDSDNSDWITVDWQSSVNNDKKDKDYSRLIEKIPFEDISAFFFEPGNSSGLVKLPPKGLIQAIVKKVHENKGWVVVDEVTTGIGRTGKWFGYEHYGIEPDIIACGKGIGNGYPVSVLALNQSFYHSLIKKQLQYAQSHQNDPLGCAVVKAVLDCITEENLLERSASLGAYLIDKLEGIKSRVNCVKEVRGVGLMCAIELNDSIDPDMLLGIHRKMYNSGYIVGAKPLAKVIRFYPPLIADKEMLDGLTKTLEHILKIYDEV